MSILFDLPLKFKEIGFHFFQDYDVRFVFGVDGTEFLLPGLDFCFIVIVVTLALPFPGRVCVTDVPVVAAAQGWRSVVRHDSSEFLARLASRIFLSGVRFVANDALNFIPFRVSAWLFQCRVVFLCYPRRFLRG